MREAMGRKRILEPVKKPKSSKKRKNDTKISAASQAVLISRNTVIPTRKSQM